MLKFKEIIDFANQMGKNTNEIYEKFHKHIRLQNKVVTKGNFTYKEIIRVLNNIFPLLVGRKVLDIGCGSGSLTFYIAKQGFKVLGLDISQKAVKCCKLNARFLNLVEKTHFEVANFPEKFPKGKFDLVICSEIVEHIKNDNECLLKIHNLLSKNGILIISAPSSNSLLYKIGLLKEFDEKVGHIRRYTIENLKEKLQNNNFRVLEIKKVEGILRNALFSFNIFNFVIKIANSFLFASEIISLLDKFFIPFFGESDLIFVAKINEK